MSRSAKPTITAGSSERHLSDLGDDHWPAAEPRLLMTNPGYELASLVNGLMAIQHTLGYLTVGQLSALRDSPEATDWGHDLHDAARTILLVAAALETQQPLPRKDHP